MVPIVARCPRRTTPTNLTLVVKITGRHPDRPPEGRRVDRDRHAPPPGSSARSRCWVSCSISSVTERDPARRCTVAVSPVTKATKTRTRKQAPDENEDDEPRHPQRLRIDERGRDGRHRVGVELDRVAEDAVRAPGDEGHDRDEEGKTEHVESRPHPPWEGHVERVDANVGALEERIGEGPRARNSERVAGELVRPSDGESEELPDHDVDPDEERGRDQQAGAEPRSGPGDAVREREQAVHFSGWAQGGLRPDRSRSGRSPP